jgi:peptidyl-prolyl cis-trans isomerase SurA
MKIKLLSVIVLVVFFYPVVNSPAEISNRVVAMVNNDVITLYELNNRIRELTGKSSDEIKAQDEEQFIEIRRQTLDDLITKKIAQEQVQELKIQISEEDIDSYIENIKKANKLTQEDLIAGLKQEGITLEGYRKEIREEMERSELIDYEVKSKAVILEDQLLKYYQGHLDEYKVEERVQIAGIFLMIKDQDNKDELAELTKKGEDILARLKNGEDFGALAKEYSQGPGADEGGELGEYKGDEIDPELKKVIDGLSEGNISNLITGESGIQIIKLIKRAGGNIKPFEEVKSKINETIYNEELNKRYSVWIKDLREKSYTKIYF